MVQQVSLAQSLALNRHLELADDPELGALVIEKSVYFREKLYG
jgi:hypothetical protein